MSHMVGSTQTDGWAGAKPAACNQLLRSVKSSQVVGLRDQAAIIRALLHAFPPCYSYDNDSYSIRHWTDVPPGEVCNVPLFIAGST